MNLLALRLLSISFVTNDVNNRVQSLIHVNLDFGEFDHLLGDDRDSFFRSDLSINKR